MSDDCDSGQFMLFAGSSFYASGGMFDFIDAFASLELALDQAQEEMRHKDWFHIVDVRTKKIVAYAPGEYCGDDEDERAGAIMYRPDDDGKLKVVS